MTTKEPRTKLVRKEGKEEFRHVNRIVVGMAAGTDNRFSHCFSVDDESSKRNLLIPETGIERFECGAWFNIEEYWRRRFMGFNCGGQYLGRPGKWNEAELRRDRDEWKEHMIVDGRLGAKRCPLSSLSSNPSLFIANTLLISPAQGSPLHYRFMDIISYLLSLLGYMISISILAFETELLISLVPHICSSHLTAFPCLSVAIHSLHFSCPKSWSHP